jgi:hypothetical protein
MGAVRQRSEERSKDEPMAAMADMAARAPCAGARGVVKQDGRTAMWWKLVLVGLLAAFTAAAEDQSQPSPPSGGSWLKPKLPELRQGSGLAFQLPAVPKPQEPAVSSESRSLIVRVLPRSKATVSEGSRPCSIPLKAVLPPPVRLPMRQFAPPAVPPPIRMVPVPAPPCGEPVK